jgi:tRNA-2-methylthio-N6-dimethylallyladenosine synthase
MSIAHQRQEPGRPRVKRLFIQTYGCQANVYDSDRMRDLLAPHGYAMADAPAEADLVILNTCHIREKATEKMYSELGRLREHKRARADAGAATTIVVAGCVAQAEGAEIVRRAPAVDFVVGPQSYHRLPELIARHDRASGESVVADFEPAAKFDALPAPSAEGVSAFVAIQEGCDKFCTFCVVPYTRGAEYSRPVADVVREVEQLLAQGVREVTLLGQNVNAYHGADGTGAESTFAALLMRLARIEGLERIRYTTSHPRDMSEDLIALHGTEPKLMPYLHLPVQSGSTRILKAMNRKHTAEEYFAIVEKLRAARPDIALSSDFIVGFPGESEADFEATLDLIRVARISAAYSFKYSRRPGTPAAVMHAQVPDEVADERLQRLHTLVQAQQLAFNQSQLGRKVPILVAGPGRRAGQIQGRSPYLQGVHFEGPTSMIGRVVDVRIQGATLGSLSGELASGELA